METSVQYFDRDISWLAFNELVLREAGKPAVPLMERIRFLSIYSSNLDEFYRVRMPVQMALHYLSGDGGEELAKTNLKEVRKVIGAQLELFGQTLTQHIIPSLKKNNVHLFYQESLPEEVLAAVNDYLYSQILAFLQPIDLTDNNTPFFPENNKIYFVVMIEQGGLEKNMILNIPSDQLPRFYPVNIDKTQYVVFLDDIIRFNLDKIFKGASVKGCFSIKITRDAEIDVKDEYSGDILDGIENELKKRDSGLATRFLYEPGLPLRLLYLVQSRLNLSVDSITEGGRYHNLKDLGQMPVKNPQLNYDQWPALPVKEINYKLSLFDQLKKKDICIHAPYQSYNTILRFFNEAAIDPAVEEIYITLYRVASNSRIVNALISAAENGKKVFVMIELKARFDEANNIKWAKKMKNAGVRIVYSVAALKVHAKVALIKRNIDGRNSYSGLLSTGNFNETTAAFYTDHILITTNHDILREVELLFIFLLKRKKPGSEDKINFKYLLVAQFNLQSRFLELIDREIANAKKGLAASITIKMNNLEERVLINKLYEASQAGVRIKMIVRSICCLVPGIAGLSENISIIRIVDRYLEHGRVFLFHNNGRQDLYMGSSDWMNRNIYHRIEVCFPVTEPTMKQQIIEMLNLQLNDNVQAVQIDEKLNNVKVENGEPLNESQKQIYILLKNKLQEPVLQ
ncbi:polyphosphate kinase 1 [Mucilaginibacter sp. BT774]|uniref:polyphosphate kinase 1 n=1 Tax=Mucilaginibacter sp. BT774 TaxID=3062276 RepID=UPI0026771845|nr:polyphosphate kinase 1 [Mucilaginibacter sp. BT774]MDO3628331.1 polyphosphate kinase 1 [Mucilaginibacter sp. BT774]